MKYEIEFARLPISFLEDILNNFSRDKLRDLARKNDIPVGRNKSNTIDNLIWNMHWDCFVSIEIYNK